jgi:hypothetical protein
LITELEKVNGEISFLSSLDLSSLEISLILTKKKSILSIYFQKMFSLSLAEKNFDLK